MCKIFDVMPTFMTMPTDQCELLTTQDEFSMTLCAKVIKKCLKAIPEHKERKAKILEVCTCPFSSVISWIIYCNMYEF